MPMAILSANANDAFQAICLIGITPRGAAVRAERTMRLICTIQEGAVTLSNDEATVEVQTITLKPFDLRERSAYRK